MAGFEGEIAKDFTWCCRMKGSLTEAWRYQAKASPPALLCSIVLYSRPIPAGQAATRGESSSFGNGFPDDSKGRVRVGGFERNSLLSPGCAAFQAISLGVHALFENFFLRHCSFQTLSLSCIIGKRILVGCLSGFPFASGDILIELGLIQTPLGPLPLLGAPDQGQGGQQSQ